MTEEERKIIGTNIKGFREARKLSQVEVGNACGYENERTAQGNVSRWERGLCCPPIEKLRPLANVLHCTIDDILP